MIPELVDVDRDGVVIKEKWPKRPLTVTGNRDHSLRVWDLPRPGDAEFRCYGPEEIEDDLDQVSAVIVSSRTLTNSLNLILEC